MVDSDLERLRAMRPVECDQRENVRDDRELAHRRRKQKLSAKNHALVEREQALNELCAAERECERKRRHNNPQIARLQKRRKRVRANGQSALHKALHAREKGDGTARDHMQRSRSCGGMVGVYSDKKRQLNEENRDALDRLQRAIEAYNLAKQNYQDAEAEYVQADAECQQATAEYDRVMTQLQPLLPVMNDWLREFTAACERARPEILRQAGVPDEYVDVAKIVAKLNGKINIYFGGDQVTGEGHAHYVIDSSGKLEYRRDPHRPHGAHNFVPGRREAPVLALAQRAAEEWVGDQPAPWTTRYSSDEFEVRTLVVYDTTWQCHVTYVVIRDKRNKRERYNVKFDEQRKQLHAQWRVCGPRQPV